MRATFCSMSEDRKKASEDVWEKFLNPQKLKRNLISASVFLAAYELLKQSLIEQLRGFYSTELDASGGWRISEEYRTEVLALDKREMVACSKWFLKVGALGADDLVVLKELAEHRNFIAHELPEIIGASNEVSLLHMRCIYAVTSKIDNWWIREIEIPVNPNFDGREFTEEELSGCFSMRVMIMSLLIEIAEGGDSALASVYDLWKNKPKGSGGG